MNSLKIGIIHVVIGDKTSKNPRAQIAFADFLSISLIYPTFSGLKISDIVGCFYLR